MAIDVSVPATKAWTGSTKAMGSARVMCGKASWSHGGTIHVHPLMDCRMYDND